MDLAINLKVKILDDRAILPTRGSEEAAGWDLYAIEDMEIPPFETRPCSTGLAFELPSGTFGAIFARSGLATKQGLRPANCTGVCDADYRGPYIVALHNDRNTPAHIKAGDRIAQLIIMPYIKVDGFTMASELSETTRGAGGFGSTGK